MFLYILSIASVMSCVLWRTAAALLECLTDDVKRTGPRTKAQVLSAHQFSAIWSLEHF